MTPLPNDLKSWRASTSEGFLIWQDVAGTGLWIVLALALIFWPWMG